MSGNANSQPVKLAGHPANGAARETPLHTAQAMKRWQIPAILLGYGWHTATIVTVDAIHFSHRENSSWTAASF
jgi:hypothetical protein